MMMKKPVAILLIVILSWTSWACRGTSERPTSSADADLATLASWMSGSFSSTAQHEATKDAPEDARYFDIRLHMSPIWTERDDGHWLYVEQAVASAQDRPYRQRVYRVHAEAGGFASDVYLLPGDEKRFAGAWRRPELLATVTPESLVPREGCSIHLKRDASGAFVGSTEGDLCPSERQGAKYATSKVTITESMLTSWDQGFDASGKQVWGAVTGPYRFVKDR